MGFFLSRKIIGSLKCVTAVNLTVPAEISELDFYQIYRVFARLFVLKVLLTTSFVATKATSCRRLLQNFWHCSENSQLKEQFKVERVLAKSYRGLCARLLAKFFALYFLSLTALSL